jgi:ABC-type branched-subunit amino acid transport system substrate-binding protein
MPGRKRLVTFAFSLLVIVVAAAAASASTQHSSSGAAATPSFQLRIGTILPFTGALSATGPSINAAAQLAVDTINQALTSLGLSSKISVDLVDSQDDQTATAPAIEAATKEVKIDKVNLIVGTMSSTSTIAVAQAVTIPNKVLLISPTASSPAITALKAGLGRTRSVYRMLPSDNFQGAALAGAALLAFGKGATVNVGARNDDFGTALQAVFVKTWKAMGGKVGAQVNWDPNATTFDTEAQKLAAGNPKGWVIIDYPETFAKVGPALIRTGNWSPAKTLMTDVMSIPASLAQVGKPATVGLRGTAPASLAPSNPQVAAFAKLFKAKDSKFPVTGYEGTSFDAVMVAFLAALQGHSASPQAMEANLQSVSDPGAGKTVVTYQNLAQAIKLILAGKKIKYEGVFGPVDFDSHGDVGSAVYRYWKYNGTTVSTLKLFNYGG